MIIFEYQIRNSLISSRKPKQMDLDQLKQICLTIPGSSMDITWGKNLEFTINERMYISCGMRSPFTSYLKVPKDQFEKIIKTPGIDPAPLKAHLQWVEVKNLDVFTKEEWEKHIYKSCQLVKDDPKEAI